MCVFKYMIICVCWASKLNCISSASALNVLYLWLTSKNNCPVSLAARSHKTNSAWLIYGSHTTLTLHNDNDHETIGGIYIYGTTISIMETRFWNHTWHDLGVPLVSCSNSHPTVTFDGDNLSRSNLSFYSHIGKRQKWRSVEGWNRWHI